MDAWRMEPVKKETDVRSYAPIRSTIRSRSQARGSVVL